MAKISNVDILENEIFLCTRTNSTRRSLEGLLEKIEPKDNYQAYWSFNRVGAVIGLIAVCAAGLLIIALK